MTDFKNKKHRIIILTALFTVIISVTAVSLLFRGHLRAPYSTVYHLLKDGAPVSQQDISSAVSQNDLNTHILYRNHLFVISDSKYSVQIFSPDNRLKRISYFTISQAIIGLACQDNILTVLSQKSLTYTVVDQYNISDPKNPIRISTYTQDGIYFTSSVVGKNFYLITGKSLQSLPDNPNRYFSYIPYYKQNDNKHLISEPDVYARSASITRTYLIVSGHSIGDKDTLKSIKAFAGYYDKFILSDSRMYITAEKEKTSVTALALGDGNINIITGQEISGFADNPACMNVSGEYFTILTTSYDDVNKLVSKFTVMDSNLHIVKEINDIAPDEVISNIRYLDNKAYIFTENGTEAKAAIDYSDPVNPLELGRQKFKKNKDYYVKTEDGARISFSYKRYVKKDLNTGLLITVEDGGKKSSFYIHDRNMGTVLDSPDQYIFIDSKKKLISLTALDYYQENVYARLLSYENGKIRETGKFKKYYDYGERYSGIILGNYLCLMENSEILAVNINDRKDKVRVQI